MHLISLIITDRVRWKEKHITISLCITFIILSFTQKRIEKLIAFYHFWLVNYLILNASLVRFVCLCTLCRYLPCFVWQPPTALMKIDFIAMECVLGRKFKTSHVYREITIIIIMSAMRHHCSIFHLLHLYV